MNVEIANNDKYEVPEWSSIPRPGHSIDILKNGAIVDNLVLEKEYYSIGRFPTCDIVLDHQSISRFHAILQFGENGIFLYDCGSTHGTFLNKQKIPVRQYMSISPGSFIKFGESTRYFIMNIPETDNFVVGNSNVAIEDNDCWYNCNPKKHLKRYLDTIKQPFQCDISQESSGFQAYINIKIPLDEKEESDVNTEFSVDVEKKKKHKRGMKHLLSASGFGKLSKEAERQAILNACKQLDDIGLLKNAKNHEDYDEDNRLSDADDEDQQELRKEQERINKLLQARDDEWDDDSYLDRTQKKRKEEMTDDEIHQPRRTYDVLCGELDTVNAQISLLRKEIASIYQGEMNTSAVMDDEFESYMKSVDASMEKECQKERQERLDFLVLQQKELQKLIDFAKPTIELRNALISPSLISYSKNEPTDMNLPSNVAKNQSALSSQEASMSAKILNGKTDQESQKPTKISSALALKVQERIALERQETESTLVSGLNIIKTQKAISMKDRKHEGNIEDADIVNFGVWRPPAGQKGDGKSSLNESLGY